MKANERSSQRKSEKIPDQENKALQGKEEDQDGNTDSYGGTMTGRDGKTSRKQGNISFSFKNVFYR